MSENRVADEFDRDGHYYAQAVELAGRINSDNADKYAEALLALRDLIERAACAPKETK